MQCRKEFVMDNINDNSNQKDLQFIDLRLQNGQVELILRAMELFFDINVKKNTYWGEIPPFPTDMVSDEAPLVQELYKLLFEHKKQKDEAIKKQVEELKELGLLDDSSDDDDLY